MKKRKNLANLRLKYLEKLEESVGAMKKTTIKLAIKTESIAGGHNISFFVSNHSTSVS